MLAWIAHKVRWVTVQWAGNLLTCRQRLALPISHSQTITPCDGTSSLWSAATGRIRTDSEARLTTGGLAQNLSAATAQNNGLSVREHRGDSEAAGTLDIHEKRVGVLNQTLELVAASLLLRGRVDKVNGKSLSAVSSAHSHHALPTIVKA